MTSKKNFGLIFLALALTPIISAGLGMGITGEIGVDLNVNPLEINFGGNYTINVNNSDLWDGNAWDLDRWLLTNGSNSPTADISWGGYNLTEVNLGNFSQIVVDNIKIDGSTINGSVDLRLLASGNSMTLQAVDDIILDSINGEVDMLDSNFITTGNGTMKNLTLTAPLSSTNGWSFKGSLIPYSLVLQQEDIINSTMSQQTRFGLYPAFDGAKAGNNPTNVVIDIYGGGSPTDRTNEHRLVLGYDKEDYYQIYTNDVGGGQKVIKLDASGNSMDKIAQVVLNTDNSTSFLDTVKFEGNKIEVPDGWIIESGGANAITLSSAPSITMHGFLEMGNNNISTSGRYGVFSGGTDFGSIRFDIDTTGNTILDNHMSGIYNFNVYGSTELYIDSGQAIWSNPVRLKADNLKSTWGAGNDMSIYYNATDAILNPKEVGSGKLHILGSTIINDNLTVGSYKQYLSDDNYVFEQLHSENGKRFAFMSNGLDGGATPLIINNPSTSPTGNSGFLTSTNGLTNWTGGIAVSRWGDSSIMAYRVLEEGTLSGTFHNAVFYVDGGNKTIGSQYPINDLFWNVSNDGLTTYVNYSFEDGDTLVNVTKWRYGSGDYDYKLMDPENPDYVFDCEDSNSPNTVGEYPCSIGNGNEGQFNIHVAKCDYILRTMSISVENGGTAGELNATINGVGTDCSVSFDGTGQTVGTNNGITANTCGDLEITGNKNDGLGVIVSSTSTIVGYVVEVGYDCI